MPGVARPDGTLAYTRAGNLQVDAGGRLGTPGGDLLQPRITIPANATDVTIAPNGTVDFYNHVGAVALIGDAAGWYAPY